MENTAANRAEPDTGALSFVGYRRVSTTGQIDGYGLPAQLTDLKAYAKRGGHRLTVETDEAKSGTLPADERPGLVAALKAIAEGKADALLLPGDLDRLARELTVQEAILGQVWRAGGRVFSTTRGEILADDPDDPMRTAIRQVMGVFAQLDRALIIKRLRNGRKAKAEAGGYAGYGSPAYGQLSDGGELVTATAEDDAIALMRSLRDEGKSVRQITALLNDAGVPSKRGGVWYPQTVARVLARAES
jgi:DNA invertase Pin-like site-specific DNA recombinase